ncbi:hypothetical protein V1477_005786 [Vespula maculifrons]|uniref:Uncharacterized protein n=2 Tax=Vespula TaxID=7451 RepID=A0A834KLD2_VESVU|nr:EKC/KEOPS complex subunit TPRKB-like [Vespula vulgaris]KAF7408838.1 hypothetical protein HZH66_003375 [Vespula vulgaris]
MTDKNDYSVQLDPETKKHCTLHLFKNVENTAEIRKKVISGDLACCILKLAYIADPFQIVVAANKAAINESCNRLITKNKSTEILFYLSITKNISKSLTDFGASDNDKNILVVTIHEAEERDTVSKMIVDNIKGERLALEELKELTNLELAKRYYKIDNEELNVSTCTDSIISRIACKDFSSSRS